MNTQKILRQEALAKFITSTAQLGIDLDSLCHLRREGLEGDIAESIDYLEKKILDAYHECFRMVEKDHKPESYKQTQAWKDDV